MLSSSTKYDDPRVERSDARCGVADEDISTAPPTPTFSARFEATPHQPGSMLEACAWTCPWLSSIIISEYSSVVRCSRPVDETLNLPPRIDMLYICTSRNTVKRGAFRRLSLIQNIRICRHGKVPYRRWPQRRFTSAGLLQHPLPRWSRWQGARRQHQGPMPCPLARPAPQTLHRRCVSAPRLWCAPPLCRRPPPRVRKKAAQGAA